jgi:hypothetical protein
MRLNSGQLEAEKAALSRNVTAATVGRRRAASLDGERAHATGEAREQQAHGLDQDIAAIEQLEPVWPAGGVVGQHGIGREQGREHHDVAQQEQPEAEARHHVDRRGAALGIGDGVLSSRLRPAW